MLCETLAEFKCDMDAADVHARYKEKIEKFCDGIDPNVLKIKNCSDTLPRNVIHFDIITYCINKDSAYTLERFRCFKSMDSYLFFESGFVLEIGCKRIRNGSLVLAKVSALKVHDFYFLYYFNRNDLLR